MKKLYILTLLMSLFGVHQLHAQCTSSVIDWDYREFFAQDNGTITTYVSSAQSQTQYFALGANKVTITHNYTGNNVGGDVTNNTGETGSYGTGADVEFIGNGVITVSFQTAVSNVKFSMYDIDRSQAVAITALNGIPSANITTIAKLSGSNLTVAGGGTPTATAIAGTSTVSNSSTDGTINVDITGPITSFTITVTASSTCSFGCGTGGSETGEFYISDITACSSGSFPNNYHSVSQPFTGQPSYVLVVVDNKFYYLNPLTGIAKYIFTDNSHTNMNSVAYDPYKRLLYYTKSLSGPGSPPGVNPNEKSLRRYDFAMDTFGVALSNVNNLGIPTFGQGVESGAAAFYNGKLYWGIEGHSNANVESIVWEIDLNASNFPIAYRQVYAQQAYSGSNRLHDWADFDINDGILYDFDGGVNLSPGTNTDFYQQNLLTGAVVRYTPVAGVIPRQVAVDWQGNLYNIGSASTAIAGEISLYNGTNDEGTAVTITHNGVGLTGSWGDGGEAFRPYSDFGDAPASYDPNPLSPAVNERDTTLRLGTGINIEWLTRGQTTAANSDQFDDGVGTVKIFSNLYSTYSAKVSVHNNTGANANVMGWLDWNGNGVFDAGEASAAVSVPTNAANQNINLSWTGISSPLADGSFTFLRIRLSSTAMTSASATGWQANGETEDYRVIVNNIVLPIDLLSFEAKAVNNSSVKINWSASEDIKLSGYEVQRSHNGTEWERIAFVAASDAGGLQHYQANDSNPYRGSSKYRIKIIQTGAKAKYSDIRTVKITDLVSLFTLTPNPASTKAILTIAGDKAGEIAQVRVMDTKGNELYYQKVRLSVGSNPVNLDIPSSWTAGTYIVLVTTDAGTVNSKLVIRR